MQKEKIHDFFESILDVIGIAIMLATFFVPWSILEKVLLFVLGLILFLLVWG